MKLSCRCVSMLLIMTSSLVAQERTAMIRLSQPAAPAMLVRQNHILGRRGDFLGSATLKNIGTTSLNSYRIGWIAAYPDGKDEIGLGSPIDVPKGVEPGQTVEVPAQNVRPEGSFTVGFFIAEVHTQAGIVWKASLGDIEEQARLRAAALPFPSN
jgi:hypothetical protein